MLHQTGGPFVCIGVEEMFDVYFLGVGVFGLVRLMGEFGSSIVAFVEHCCG